MFKNTFQSGFLSILYSIGYANILVVHDLIVIIIVQNLFKFGTNALETDILRD
jgi:hypothetical protein